MIIVLSVIALITVPIVTSTMKDARKSSFKTSMLNLVKAADHYYADNQLDITSPIAFDFIRGGVSEEGKELSFKGTKPKTGRLIINVDGEITLQDVSDGTYYANYHSSSDSDVIVTSDNEVLTRDELTEAVKTLQDENKKIKEQLSSTTTIANTANTTANQLANTRLNKTYPVGSIYISYNNTNPASLFGGTWASYGTGRTLVGVDTSQAEFNAIGKTGGEKSHVLTEAEMPSHEGHYKYWDYQGDGYYLSVPKLRELNIMMPYPHRAWKITASNELDFRTSKIGGNQAHNNLQPYITVYMWRRTA